MEAHGPYVKEGCQSPMKDKKTPQNRDGSPEALENQEWLESMAEVLDRDGPERAIGLLEELRDYVNERGVKIPFRANTPFINTIPANQQQAFPGSRDVERRIKSIIRWNAMAMVVRANRAEDGIGGHISTYASAATLIEVGLNHFFRCRRDGQSGDQIYFQGHASPGIYSRAFLEGRLTEKDLLNFRRELNPGGGLSSYPHPWLMPDFWEFPTVSMGLGPIMAIYQARFNRYLEDRGLKDTSNSNVWAFLGDGETDEPETLGAISLASREKLDNLTFVINCNLQRLDGPVRGNGNIVQELEAVFRGAGWNVIKVLWGSAWDPLFERDKSGLLADYLGRMVDGDSQKLAVESGQYIREKFFGQHPELARLVENLSDDHLRKLRRGGHDPEKVYAAYYEAAQHKGAPTVILAKTVKGYGLGEAGEGRNITHQQKKLNEEELRQFRTRFNIPISDEDVARAPFFKPPEDSAEVRYLRDRRLRLGGYLPERRVEVASLKPPTIEFFEEFHKGTDGREVSTTMAFVRMLAKMLKHEEMGKLIVPIVPDEARTFGMEALFRQCGIYSHVGQLYEPIDANSLLYYKEATDGQILEEGLTEAGAMSSFIAAGTAYATHGVNTIPFFIYYSMFGMQRIGDLVWAAADMRCRGFMLGGTAGRTTLNGEGLQHEDGHSHLLAYPVPNMLTYDPAYAYEIAVIIREGIRRMYQEQESIFYYLTLYNENYAQPEMPEGVEEGILKGLYRLRDSGLGMQTAPRAHLLGSGSLMNEALKAQAMLEEKYGVATDVWSVTSYKQLYREAQETERWNMLHPSEPPRIPYVAECLSAEPGVTVAVSDYVKALPDSLARWVPGSFVSLGTDGFGRSDSRAALRDFFEVDARYLVVGALTSLTREGKIPNSVARQAIADLEIDPEKVSPLNR